MGIQVFFISGYVMIFVGVVGLFPGQGPGIFMKIVSYKGGYVYRF